MMISPNHVAILGYILNNKREMTFKELKRKTKITDGNLANNLRQLETRKYVTISKFFIGKKPMTNIIVTEEGEGYFLKCIIWLDNLLSSLESLNCEKNMEGK
jgi:DNA-binding MarR family transcriptional regulator